MQKPKPTYVKAGDDYYREDLIYGVIKDDDDSCTLLVAGVHGNNQIRVWESANTKLKRMNSNIKE